MSTKTVDGGLAAVAATDVVMVTLNPDMQDDKVVISAANESGKGVLIKKGFASGHLGETSDQRTQSIRRSFELIFETDSVDSVIVGTINPKHLEQNVEIANSVLGKTEESN